MLLLDEPTASLDPDIGDFVRSYIDTYKKINKVTILLASHNMSEVERLCSDILMLKEGKIVDKGSSKFLIKKHGRNNLEETFLKIARGAMRWHKIYALSLRHIYLIKSSFPRIFRLNILAYYTNFSMGFYFKIFYTKF